MNIIKLDILFFKYKYLEDLENVIRKKYFHFYKNISMMIEINMLLLNQSYRFPEQNKLLVKINQNIENLFNREFNDLVEFRNKDIFRLKENLTIESFQEMINLFMNDILTITQSIK